MDQYEQYYVPPPVPAPSDSPEDHNDFLRSLRLFDWDLGTSFGTSFSGATSGSHDDALPGTAFAQRLRAFRQRSFLTFHNYYQPPSSSDRLRSTANDIWGSRDALNYQSRIGSSENRGSSSTSTSRHDNAMRRVFDPEDDSWHVCQRNCPVHRRPEDRDEESRNSQEDRNGRSSQQYRRLRESSSREYRHCIYVRGLYAKSPPADSRIRSTEPNFYSCNPACVHRLVPWLNRELGVLLHDREDAISKVLKEILALIKQVKIRSRDFYNAMRPHLVGRTIHFIHEFDNFAASPYENSSTWDRQVKHERRRPRIEQRPDVNTDDFLQELESASDSEEDTDEDVGDYLYRSTTPTSDEELERLAREQRRINDANAPSGRESGVPRRGDARCGSEDRGNNASAPSGRQSGVQRREDARRGSDEGGNGGRVGRYLTSRDRNRLIDPDRLNNGREGERDGEAVTPPRMTGRERTPEDAGRRDMNESASRNRLRKNLDQCSLERLPRSLDANSDQGNSSTNNSPASPTILSARGDARGDAREASFAATLLRLRRSLDGDSERGSSREGDNTLTRRRSLNPSLGPVRRNAGSGLLGLQVAALGSSTAQTGWETPPLDSQSSGSGQSSPYVTAQESKTSTCPSPTLSDVEVVGFVKAMADRTPVEVTLSSDDADSGDPDIIMERRKKRSCKNAGEETGGGGSSWDLVDEADKIKEDASAKRKKERRRRRREAQRKSAAENADVDNIANEVDVEKEDRARGSSRSKSSTKSSNSISQRLLQLTRQNYDRRGNPTNDEGDGNALRDDDVEGRDTPSDANTFLTSKLNTDDEDSDIAEALRLNRAIHNETVVIGDSDYEDDDDDVIIEGVSQASSLESRRHRRSRRNGRRRLSENSNDDDDIEDGDNSNSSSSTQASAYGPASSVLKAKVWDFLESTRREREIADRARVGGNENRGWDAEEEEEEMARKRNRSPSSRGAEGGGGERGAEERGEKSPGRKKGNGAGKGKGKGKGKSSKKLEAAVSSEETDQTEGTSSGEGPSSDAMQSKTSSQEEVVEDQNTESTSTVDSDENSGEGDATVLVNTISSQNSETTARYTEAVLSDDLESFVDDDDARKDICSIIGSPRSSTNPGKLKSVVSMSSIFMKEVDKMEEGDEMEEEEKKEKANSDDERVKLKKGELRSVVERPKNCPKIRHRSESTSSAKAKKSKKEKRKREFDRDDGSGKSEKKKRCEDTKKKRLKS